MVEIVKPATFCDRLRELLHVSSYLLPSLLNASSIFAACFLIASHWWAYTIKPHFLPSVLMISAGPYLPSVCAISNAGAAAAAFAAGAGLGASISCAMPASFLSCSFSLLRIASSVALLICVFFDDERVAI